jgi:uncharacterized damage-inducible protein DinB
MTAKDAIKSTLTSTQQMLGMYLADLADADLLARPVPNANHIAWQIGHLIQSEHMMIKAVSPKTALPKLPDGFSDQYGKVTASQEPPKGFATKAVYLDLFNKTREATLKALAELPDADLEKATPGEMAKYAPTVAAVFLMAANHTMMHAGQFTVVRRKLGKPILF